jgi:hypothetical protein
MTTCPTASARARAVRALRAASIAVLVLLAASAPALAVSTRDLVALSQAGLSDEVLIALVEADETTFALDAPQILELRREGLSERVILAMIRNAHRGPAADGAAPPPFDATEPASFTAIGEPPEPPPITVQQTNVIVMPFIPFPSRPVVPAARPPVATVPAGYQGFGRFMNDGWLDGRPPFGPR